MDKPRSGVVFLILVCIQTFCNGQYKIPEVVFEAFTPRGLRVSIPAGKGVEMFAFHGNINKPIEQIQPGEIVQDVTRPNSNRFTYVEPNLKLKKGDVINYWVFVQHDQLGFRKDQLSWTVDRLLPEAELNRGTEVTCSTPSITKVEDQDKVCPGDEIIQYRFSEKPIDSRIWTIEQYIPGGPDWPFILYRNSPEVVDIENGVLRIKPKLEEDNVRKNVVLNSCTRDGLCSRDYLSIWNAPIASGKLTSKKAFCFGNITIRAMLPLGDYLYPEIFLEDPEDPGRRILIAYARGNRNYVGPDGTDDGAKKLFAGAYRNVTDVTKLKKLLAHEEPVPIGSSWHTFGILWRPDVIEAFMDGVSFGSQNTEILRRSGFDKANMVRLVLGIAAGGPFEFPDEYLSSGSKKPYKTTSRDAVKAFITNKEAWFNTWKQEDVQPPLPSQLRVEYVSVTAL